MENSIGDQNAQGIRGPCATVKWNSFKKRRKKSVEEVFQVGNRQSQVTKENEELVQNVLKENDLKYLT